MKQSIIILVAFSIFGLNACSQNTSAKQNKTHAPGKPVGDGCEGCEAIHDSPIPLEKLSWIDTLPDYNEPGPKMMISGTIYQPDGQTPASDVILYIYHTDQNGNYTNKGDLKGAAKRHGYIRGWMKTNENGQYKFYTLRPASYPNSKAPQHIHPTIKEANKNEYWIDEFVFEDDPNLGDDHKKHEQGRGGKGTVSLKNDNGILVGRRDIYLGKNIPNYPTSLNSSLNSGLAIGANCPAFDPLHLTGADKGKAACPMCKYGKGQGVMVWFNHNNLDQMKKFVTGLEAQMQQRGETNFRVFLVYMNPSYADNDATGLKILQGKHKKWAAEQNLQKVALVWVPSPMDEETSGLYEVNPNVKNTVFIYKKRTIVAKWVNMDYSDHAVKTILEKIDQPS